MASAQTFKSLASFDGSDGISPQSLIQGADGNFYGVTYSGGLNNNTGTIFKITTDGTLSTLHNFCSQTNCTDGAAPAAQLLQADDGNLYGTTYLGGSNCVTGSDSNTGCGTVFKLTQGSDGSLYGTTGYGGAFCVAQSGYSGCGAVFKVTPSGRLVNLHSFNSTDGASPQSALLQTSDGTLYGTTMQGGSSSACSGGCGTVFSLTLAVPRSQQSAAKGDNPQRCYL